MPRQRADDVVGLDAFDAQQRKCPCASIASSSGSTCARSSSGIGGRFALYSVYSSSAERLAGRVEHDGHARRLHLVEQLVEHVDDAEHGVRRLAGLRRQRRDRVKRAIQIRRAVDEDERASAHPDARRPSGSGCAGRRRIDALDGPRVLGQDERPVWPQPATAAATQGREERDAGASRHDSSLRFKQRGDAPIRLAKRQPLLHDELVRLLGRVELGRELDVLGPEAHVRQRVRHDREHVGREIDAAKERRLEPLQVAVIAGRQLRRDRQRSPAARRAPSPARRARARRRRDCASAA